MKSVVVLGGPLVVVVDGRSENGGGEVERHDHAGVVTEPRPPAVTLCHVSIAAAAPKSVHT
jgi:hypothetical protein